MGSEPRIANRDSWKLKSIEAKYITADQVEVYYQDELIQIVPNQVAKQAVQTGYADLVNPSAIQVRAGDAVEFRNVMEKMGRECKRLAAFKAGQAKKQ